MNPQNNWTIRKMLPEDAEEVHRLDVLSFSLPWPRRSFDYELNQNPNARCWVLEQTDPQGSKQITAMMVCWVVLDEMHIATFAVHPEKRRQGIGRSLLVHALREAQKEKVDLVFLEVRRTNVAAQALYRQFGFEESGIRKNYYADTQEDALNMTLTGLQGRTL